MNPLDQLMNPGLDPLQMILQSAARGSQAPVQPPQSALEALLAQGRPDLPDVQPEAISTKERVLTTISDMLRTYGKAMVRQPVGKSQLAALRELRQQQADKETERQTRRQDQDFRYDVLGAQATDARTAREVGREARKAEIKGKQEHETSEREASEKARERYGSLSIKQQEESSARLAASDRSWREYMAGLPSEEMRTAAGQRVQGLREMVATQFPDRVEERLAQGDSPASIRESFMKELSVFATTPEELAAVKAVFDMFVEPILVKAGQPEAGLAGSAPAWMVASYNKIRDAHIGDVVVDTVKDLFGRSKDKAQNTIPLGPIGGGR